MTEKITGQDIHEAIGRASPLIDPRLSEVEWDNVATELNRYHSDCGDSCDCYFRGKDTERINHECVI